MYVKHHCTLAPHVADPLPYVLLQLEKVHLAQVYRFEHLVNYSTLTTSK